MSKIPLPEPPQDTITLHCRMNPREIAFVTSVLEGYPGYALLRTIDRKKGIIDFWIAPDYYQEVREILDEIKDEINLVILEQ